MIHHNTHDIHDDAGPLLKALANATEAATTAYPGSDVLMTETVAALQQHCSSLASNASEPAGGISGSNIDELNFAIQVGTGCLIRQGHAFITVNLYLPLTNQINISLLGYLGCCSLSSTTQP